MYCVSSLGTKYKIQNTIFLAACCLLLTVNYCAQTKPIREETNRFLSLDVYKLHGMKRIKFYEQDKIIVKVKTYRNKFKGTIFSLRDTALVLDSTVILYKDIEKIIVDNNNSLTKVAERFLGYSGIGYMALDALNNAINNNKPVVNPRTIAIGLGLIVTGQAIKLLSIKHYKINSRHRIKFIDDNPKDN